MPDWVDLSAGDIVYSPQGERLRVIWWEHPGGDRVWSFAAEDDGGDLVMDAPQAPAAALLRYELQVDGGLIAHYADGRQSPAVFDLYDLRRPAGDDDLDLEVWGWIVGLL